MSKVKESEMVSRYTDNVKYIQFTYELNIYIGSLFLAINKR